MLFIHLINMLEYQELNRKIESFNFESFISAEDQMLAIADTETLIKNGRYQKNNPLYQTDYENIFNLIGSHWAKLKYSYLASCFAYLGHEPFILKMNSWCYMTNDQIEEDRNKLWHKHQSDNQRMLTGIYYLHIPDDVSDITTCGTEFALDGLDGTNKWASTVRPYHWLIFPGETWHRPCPPQSAKYRFVLAADLVY